MGAAKGETAPNGGEVVGTDENTGQRRIAIGRVPEKYNGENLEITVEHLHAPRGGSHTYRIIHRDTTHEASQCPPKGCMFSDSPIAIACCGEAVGSDIHKVGVFDGVTRWAHIQLVGATLIL